MAQKFHDLSYTCDYVNTSNSSNLLLNTSYTLRAMAKHLEVTVPFNPHTNLVIRRYYYNPHFLHEKTEA